MNNDTAKYSVVHFLSMKIKNFITGEKTWKFLIQISVLLAYTTKSFFFFNSKQRFCDKSDRCSIFSLLHFKKELENAEENIYVCLLVSEPLRHNWDFYVCLSKQLQYDHEIQRTCS